VIESGAITKLSGYDSTAAFLREGYTFVGSRCRDLETDRFRTRLMLRPVTCLCGVEAAREFYQPGRMSRRGAMPASVLALLQGKGSVQTLDGHAHAERKAMFMNLMTSEALQHARTLFAEEWEAAARTWQGCEVSLRDGVNGVLTRTAMRWCGINPAGQDVAARNEEFTAMIDCAGSVGPGWLRAKYLRTRAERWARELIRKIREGAPDIGGATRHLALHRDTGGNRLDDQIAAVELLNILRPIVAVARFIVFAAHALHVHRAFIPEGQHEDQNRSIGHEVRRLYPFFPVIGGRVLNPFDWRGAEFERGEWLVLDLFGTNRDASVWTSPATFRPERHLAQEAPAYGLVPQGGGDFQTGHRCPGEWLTVELLTEAVAQLRALDWDAPDQNLRVSLRDIPPWPQGGMRIRVAPASPLARC